ncbi:DnaJ-class molecular chaperone [Bacillus niacini]|jgi:DnaJ-class molecular chaperone|uniref:DnaJ-class molecular chaperone n=1 Tax=Neobacillus niacini TaxID=86668 RepID=A0A852TIK3_9BACI|nr:DnaJ-class molecular chaperone [Neobacillus niacini]
MVPFIFFEYLKEKRREKNFQRGICADCSGRGFFSSGFETVHVEDCNTCLGTGKALKDF